MWWRGQRAIEIKIAFFYQVKGQNVSKLRFVKSGYSTENARTWLRTHWISFLYIQRYTDFDLKTPDPVLHIKLTNHNTKYSNVFFLAQSSHRFLPDLLKMLECANRIKVIAAKKLVGLPSSNSDNINFIRFALIPLEKVRINLSLDMGLTTGLSGLSCFEVATSLSEGKLWIHNHSIGFRQARHATAAMTAVYAPATVQLWIYKVIANCKYMK